MRILLIAPLHRQLEYFSGRRSTPFLPSQGQQSWIEAMRKLGHNVLTFRSNDAVFIPNIFSAMIGEQIENHAGHFFGRYRNLNNKFYKLNLSNYIKNKTLFNLAGKFHPDVIMLSGGTTEIFPETIKKIKTIKRRNRESCK